MAGAATGLRADVWKTADSLGLSGVEWAGEGAVQRRTRVQKCANWALGGLQTSSRRRVPIAMNGFFSCRYQELLAASHGLHRRRNGLDPPYHGHLKNVGVRGTPKAVLAGSEEAASVWRRRRVSGGGNGGKEGKDENRFSFGGETKCSPRAVRRLWLMTVERQRRGFVLLRATRTPPSPSVKGEEDKEEEEKAKEAFVRPKLPGDEPDFWEGEQWDGVGFVLQYLWAVGIVVALIGGLVAVRTYNFGAVDYKDTIEYQSAMDIMDSTEEDSEESESQSSLPTEATSLSSPAPSE
eukprot:TRINITY_DN1160_c0_g1_i3.p1 TRINITY_DN1160_c0_g1~~TRINITY_DN1160_c0_g1_i3.p1  ORF type:complete len:294 (-),score=54.91 TRINITY_DN1160_c0_g1_i3:316-1197(-)